MPIPNPIAFTIFGIDIMWYGILIAAAMVLAVIIIYKRASLHEISPDRTLDFVLICVPLGVIGARLYYVAFNWDAYAGDFYKIINTRGGGLAIHGGLIFGFIAAALLCRAWRVRPLNLLDLTVPAIALAQSIGRWGNYFNSEAHGGPTDLPWAINVNGEMVHPTFLYESIWCFILFFVLIVVDNNRKFEGQTFLLYGILYSFERFFVEGLRTDSLMIGPFRQAQVLSLAVFVICLVAYIIKRQRSKYKNRIFY
ncbi:prolipoprotein diacylglyceryl transferase [Sinanaerobacter chloroacetimidivorans]|jgi:phosphatidylglycerol:prolipoprotein diacylglycerol transferase|uniref:Phosphatidylglycerol--prolipoprotein diacylglyceryl transferase n=1 Tax=Sinanaerobacter chloroacetimidivorans TaxID=2818044 RepID=A0A8J8B015_9FIRM|nr:prolipoprotein diacylglyceryl transferase [Sinanaerobacter chloroacetimidivorans]MBR0597113.1 prolipoprotein diacylglyceryl transferase [Sinanaerobacter chloroacetimidivorans]